MAILRAHQFKTPAIHFHLKHSPKDTPRLDGSMMLIRNWEIPTVAPLVWQVTMDSMTVSRSAKFSSVAYSNAAAPGGSEGGHRSYATSIASHSTIPHTSQFGDQATSEPYQAWSSDRQIPMSTEEIEDIFLDLTQKFGFQRDSMRNMVSGNQYSAIQVR